MNLGFDVMTIRSVHSAEERTSACAAFNDPRSSVEILLCSLKTTSVSVNLQKSCADVVFVDIPINGNTLLQGLGRIYRIGQTRPVRAWILVLEYTYDQVLQARCAKKLLTNISGTADYNPTAEDEAAWLTEAGEEPESRPLTEDELASIRDAKACTMYVACFGQCTPRHEWTDAHDLKAKDRLPSQAMKTDPRTTDISSPSPFKTKTGSSRSCP